MTELLVLVPQKGGTSHDSIMTGHVECTPRDRCLDRSRTEKSKILLLLFRIFVIFFRHIWYVTLGFLRSCKYYIIDENIKRKKREKNHS